MVSVDKPSLEQALTRWNQFVAGKIEMTQLSGKAVLLKEAGRLVQTLIRITPPEDRKKSQDKLDKRVQGKFQKLGEGNYGELLGNLTGKKNGSGDVRWYAWSSTGLYGVATDYDLTNANVDGLKAIYYQTAMNRERKIVAGRRGKQTVYLHQRYLTKAATVKKLATRLKGHFGRLKAGWLVSWIQLGRPQGEYAPPQWVTKHENGARGKCEIVLGDKSNPQITLVNQAAGSGSELMNRIARDAMVIRINAMVKRMSFLLKHPEKLSEEV